MSFDIALWYMKGKDFGVFPRALVEEFLGHYAVKENDTDWTLSFPDGGQGYLSLMNDGAELISGFWVNRPGGQVLYDAIFEIMHRTPTVLWWPGGAAVANEATLPNLLADMVADVGKVGVVKNGVELAEWIETH